MKFAATIPAFLIGALVMAQEPQESQMPTAAVLEAQIEDAISRLAHQRELEAEERVVLGGKVAELEKQLLEGRRKRDMARLSADGREQMIAELEKKHSVYERDFHYMRGLYRDFAVYFESQMQAGEASKYQALIDQSIDSRSTINEQSLILDAAIDRLESVLGGERLAAEVVSGSEEVLEGEVIHVGPVSWFKSHDGAYLGSVYRPLSGKQARLIEESEKQVEQLFNGRPAMLSVDVTGGKARAISQIQGDSGRLFEKGGTWLWVILVIAFVSALCAVMKMVQLFKIKDPDSDLVAQLLRALREDRSAEAEGLLDGLNHPVGGVLKSALASVSAGADVVEEVVYEQLIGVQAQLQKWLPFIAVTAATAPLLGLLGTVSGMIRMFNVITVTGTGDVKPMAGGISEALITTLFGLIVAIPALILHTILSRRSNGVVQNTEKLGLSFVNGLRKMS